MSDSDKQAGLSKAIPAASDADRQFWLDVRRALLAIVAAIERRWGIDKSSNHHGQDRFSLDKSIVTGSHSIESRRPRHALRLSASRAFWCARTIRRSYG